MEAELRELNHLSTSGREIKRDSESSGERNRKSLNRLIGGVEGPRCLYFHGSGKVLGKPAGEGESPVSETMRMR